MQYSPSPLPSAGEPRPPCRPHIATLSLGSLSDAAERMYSNAVADFPSVSATHPASDNAVRCMFVEWAAWLVAASCHFPAGLLVRPMRALILNLTVPIGGTV